MIEKKEGELEQTVGKTKVNDIVIENLWKKIIFVGVIIFLAVVATEFVGTYFEDKDIPFLQTTYFLYSCIGIVGVVVLVLLIWFMIKRKKSEKIKNWKVKKNVIREVSDKDTKRVLGVVDALLEKLPQNEIAKFAKSKDAELYKAILKKHGVR